MSASASNGPRPHQDVIDLVSSGDEEDEAVPVNYPPRNTRYPGVREPVPRLPDHNPIPPADNFQEFDDPFLAGYGNFDFIDLPAAPGALPEGAVPGLAKGNMELAAPLPGGQIVVVDGEEVFIPDSPGLGTRPTPAPLPQWIQNMDEETALAMDEQNFTADTCLQRILVVCPEVSHDYVTTLYTEFESEVPGPMRFESILDKLLFSDDYPKRGKGKQVLRKRKREEAEDDHARKRWEAPDREFVPFANGMKTAMIAALKADFPEIPNKQIEQELRSNKHFYTTYIALAKAIDSNDGNIRLSGRASKKSASADTIALNSTFHEELQAARKRVESHRAEKMAEQAKRRVEEENLQRAIESGETAECQACFDDLAMNRQIHCNGDVAHFTCFDCATTYLKSEVGESRSGMLCVAGCGSGYARAQLHRLEDKVLLEKLEQLRQEKDIRDAGLDDLEECPFCEYKAILPPIEEDFEFRCANPECEKVSCRRCKAVSHIPKSCEEHAKEHRLDSRHKIEEAMTAAMLRSCNKCKKQFIKDFGCNKMSCPSCGNLQCYVCSQSLKDYNHFDQGTGGPNASRGTGKKCPLYDNVEERHEREVKEAEAAARAQVMEDDPDVTEEDLQIKVSDAVKKSTEDRIKRAAGGPGGYPGAGPYGGLLGLAPGRRNAHMDEADYSDENGSDDDDDSDNDDDDDSDDEDDRDGTGLRIARARNIVRAGARARPAMDDRLAAMRERLNALQDLVQDGGRHGLGGHIAGYGVHAPVARPPQPAHAGGLAHRPIAAQMHGFIPIYGIHPPAPIPPNPPAYLPVQLQPPPPQPGFNFNAPPFGEFGPGGVVGALNNGLPGQQGVFDAFAEDPFGGGDADPFGFARLFNAQYIPELQQPNQDILQNHHARRHQAHPARAQARPAREQAHQAREQARQQAEQAQRQAQQAHQAAHQAAQHAQQQAYQANQQAHTAHQQAQQAQRQAQAQLQQAREQQRQALQNMHNRAGGLGNVQVLPHADLGRYNQGRGFPGTPRNG